MSKSEKDRMPDATSMGTTTRRIASNSVAMVGWQVLGQALMFGVTILMARALGKESYGLLSFAFTYVSLFEIPALMGTNMIINREMAVLAGEEAATFWRSTLALRSGLSVISMVAALVWVVWVYWADERRLHVMVWACVGLVATLRGVYISLFRAKDMSGFSDLISLGRTFVYALLVVGVIATGGSVVAIAQASVVATLAALLVERITTDSLQPRGGRIDKAVMAEVLRRSWPLAISAGLTVLQMRVDLLMLKAFQGDAGVGAYSVAVRPVEGTYIAATAFSVAVFPALSRTFARHPSGFGVLCRESLVMMLVLGLPMAAVVAPLGMQLVPGLFGEQYASSGLPFAVLCLHVPLGFVNILLVNALFAARQQRLEMIASVATTLANIAGNIVLIPRLGLIGSSLATLACQIVALVVLGLMVQKTAAFALPVRRLLGVGSVALGVFAMVLFLRDLMPWWVLLPVAGAVYFAVCIHYVYEGFGNVVALWRKR